MRIETARFEDDGKVPNSVLPLLIYRQVIVPAADDPAEAFEAIFSENGWAGAWRNGVFDYHHYHSNAHEVLGIAAGAARLIFGGEKGRAFDVSAGDVVLIPAGTGHKRETASADFLVVGAYPRGQRDYDLIRADPAAHDEAVARIKALALPARDPVQGTDGALHQHWM